MPHHLAGGGFDGSDPAQTGEGGFAPQSLGVVPGHDQERRGAVGADARQRDQLRGGLRHQPVEVRLYSSTISLERASYRRATERSANLVAAGTSLGPSARRKRAATETSSFVESPRKRWRSCSGAVTRKPCSWLAACVLALIAERRAARRVLIISTRPSPLLGTPDASPAKTARAARSASEGSDFRRLRRELGRRCSGHSTSSTSIPMALRWRASLRPRSCLCPLPRRTSRDQNPLPSGGASRNPPRSLARSTGPSACPGDPQPQPRASRGACPRPRSPRPRCCPASRRRSSSGPKLLSLSPSASTRGAGENGRMCCEGSR